MPSSPAPLRLGIVGAGGIVRSRHLPGWRQIPNLEIRAVCNSSLQSAQSFCDAHAPQAKALARWEEVVDSDEVDVVWIGAHPNLHADATCFALDCGKHVFTQARMAATLSDAQRMWEASMRYPDLVTAICPAPHGMKHGLAFKHSLDQGDIGTPLHLNLHSFSDAYLDPTLPAHWRQLQEKSGIQILTLGIHIEVLQRWFGPIAEVAARGRCATTRRGDAEIDIPDHLQVLAGFQSGLEANLQFSAVAHRAPGDSLTVYGSKGSLSYDFQSDAITLCQVGKEPRQLQIEPQWVREWRVEEEFIAAVRDPGAPRPRPDFTEGMCYMRVVDAVWQSMEHSATARCL
jgi:predicted dehydrogenase